MRRPREKSDSDRVMLAGADRVIRRARRRLTVVTVVLVLCVASFLAAWAFLGRAGAGLLALLSIFGLLLLVVLPLHHGVGPRRSRPAGRPPPVAKPSADPREREEALEKYGPNGQEVAAFLSTLPNFSPAQWDAVCFAYEPARESYVKFLFRDKRWRRAWEEVVRLIELGERASEAAAAFDAVRNAALDGLVPATPPLSTREGEVRERGAIEGMNADAYSPTLQACLALVYRDLISQEHSATLYCSFEAVLPVESLGY
jgi:hypothetical protein